MGNGSLDKKFKALSSQNRRKIILYLRDGGKCAGDIANQFLVSAPSISYHLSVLEKSQLISSVHLEGFIYYYLNFEEMEEVIQWLNKILSKA